MVHPNSDMKKTHVDPHNAFCITAESISILDQLEVNFILYIFIMMRRTAGGLPPVVVAGS